MTPIEQIKKEIDWSNQAGLVKTKEQMELLEQQAFENGYQECLRDADSGLLKGSGIYTVSQVKTFLEMYRSAIRQSIENDIRGVYRLGSGSGDEERLSDKVIKEADEKFSGILGTADQESE